MAASNTAKTISVGLSQTLYDDLDMLSEDANMDYTNFIRMLIRNEKIAYLDRLLAFHHPSQRQFLYKSKLDEQLTSSSTLSIDSSGITELPDIIVTGGSI